MSINVAVPDIERQVKIFFLQNEMSGTEFLIDNIELTNGFMSSNVFSFFADSNLVSISGDSYTNSFAIEITSMKLAVKSEKSSPF